VQTVWIQPRGSRPTSFFDSFTPTEGSPIAAFGREYQRELFPFGCVLLEVNCENWGKVHGYCFVAASVSVDRRVTNAVFDPLLLRWKYQDEEVPQATKCDDSVT